MSITAMILVTVTMDRCRGMEKSRSTTFTGTRPGTGAAMWATPVTMLDVNTPCQAIGGAVTKADTDRARLEERDEKGANGAFLVSRYQQHSQIVLRPLSFFPSSTQRNTER
jgi:hypothetical protein